VSRGKRIMPPRQGAGIVPVRVNAQPIPTFGSLTQDWRMVTLHGRIADMRRCVSRSTMVTSPAKQRGLVCVLLSKLSEIRRSWAARGWVMSATAGAITGAECAVEGFRVVGVGYMSTCCMLERVWYGDIGEGRNGCES
jgi:hypothetical protein